MATRCNRPGCPGTISLTGYCDTCFLKPLPPEAADPAPAPASVSTPPPDPGPEPVPGPEPAPAAASEPEPAPEPRPDPAADPEPRPGTPPPPLIPRRPSPSPPPVSARRPGDLDLDGLVVLPYIRPPDPALLVKTTARPPSGGRRCGVRNCMGTIGVGYGGRPAPDSGYCPQCGEPYSFKPGLHPDDRVGEHYRVLGYLATGGLGWLYLAEDTQLPDHLVVLKGLINRGDVAARRNADDERRRLTTLHHRDIVSIITYEQHRADGESEATGYIVMEYVGGRSLQQLLVASDAEREALFGGPFSIDHVLTYGCKILGALEYLHGQGLLYCDMKPDNVIHYGQEIKIIDLGAIRRIGDHTTDLVFHPHFAPPKRERDGRGFHIDTDLYTVGRTLQALAAAATPAAGLAARSFDRLVLRATHAEPAARFTSAAEMSHQLWEVLREHRALKRHEQYPERPTRFEPTAELFGARLGAIPGLGHFTRRSGTPPPDLDASLPAPVDVVRGLPVPMPDPGDPGAALLPRLAVGSPGRIAGQVAGDSALQTVEVALWLCRAFIGSRDSGWAAARDVARAERWLRQAAEWLGEQAAAYDWRLSWHRGVLALVRGEVDRAAQEFAATFDALPGEWAPKLALGYCCEHLAERLRAQDGGALAAADGGALAAGGGAGGGSDGSEGPGGSGGSGYSAVGAVGGAGWGGAAERDAEEYYEAVWQRDRTQASAAFGLARLRLRRGERAAAVDVLDNVPSTSRHYDTAQVAVVRMLSGPVGGAVPSAGQLSEAAERLRGLRLEANEPRDRLVTEIAGTLALCRPPGGWGPNLPLDTLFGAADTDVDLRRLLYRSLRGLADQSADPDERGALLDRAYDVRPETRF